MRRLSPLGLVALLGTGACYSSYVDPPPAPQWNPAIVSGPPGGGVDPGYGYPAPGGEDPAAQGGVGPALPADPAGPAPSYEGGAVGAPEADAPGASGEAPAPTADAAGPANGIGSVNDDEIDATLSPYGQWIETEDYGRVWRPDPTVVGVDFTPYESCGSWVYTDYGWTFSCDWDWGWLPFHFGQWTWLDDGWCWVRDYTWSPAQVEWRSGGGYVGWRPLEPRIRDHRRDPGGGGGGGPIIRDHRGRTVAGGGPIIRDHRKQRDSDWRFASERDFGRTRIRAGLYRNVAEGIRVTSGVSRPGIHGGVRVGTAEVMRHRIQARAGVSVGPVRGGASRPSVGATQPLTPPPGRGGFQPPGRGYERPGRAYQPGPVRPEPPVRSGVETAAPPSRGVYQPTYQPPSRGTHAPVYEPPSRGAYQPTYQPPSRGTHSSSGGFSPPSRGGGGGGGVIVSPPSHSGGGFSPPSHSSSSSSGWHSSGSSGSSGSSSGGSSHSSSSGGSSHSSGSSSGGSSHSSGSSSGGSSHSSGSSSGGSSHSSGGGSHRH